MADEKLDEAEKKKGKPLLAIGIVTVLVAVISAGSAAYAIQSGYFSNDKGTAAPEVVIEDNAYIPLEDLVVNINTDKPVRKRHYLKVAPVLEIINEESKARIEKQMPVIRNTLISLYSRQKAEELFLGGSADVLRAKSLQAAKATLRTPEDKELITQVLFKKYLVQ